MKIADFFIAIGFDIKGADQAAKANETLTKLEATGAKAIAAASGLNAATQKAPPVLAQASTATQNYTLHLGKMLVVIGSIQTAFFAMITKAVEAGVVLQKFSLLTAESTDELQQWQAAAVRGNAAASAIAGTVKSIQDARASLAFGDGSAAAPWMLLGIDPRQDPFKVLKQLQGVLKDMDPAIMGKVGRDLGLSPEILYLIKQGRLGSGGLAQSLIVSPAEYDRLAKLGGAWKTLLFTIGQVATRFASTLEGPMTHFLDATTKALVAAGRFVDWLEKGSTGARVFLAAVLGIVGAFVALGVVVGALALGPFGEFLLAAGVLAGVIAYLVLRIQDLWVGLQGGKTAWSVGDNILTLAAHFNQLAASMKAVVELWKWISGQDFSKIGNFIKDDFHRGEQFWRNGAGAANTSTSSNSQTNHIAVKVEGGATPYDTGRAVGRGMLRQISDAFSQAPVPSR